MCSIGQESVMMMHLPKNLNMVTCASSHQVIDRLVSLTASDGGRWCARLLPTAQPPV